MTRACNLLAKVTVALTFAIAVLNAEAQEPNVNKVIAIGSRLELMVDDFLIAKMDGTHLQLQTPQEMPLSDNPLLKADNTTVSKDGNLYGDFGTHKDDEGYAAVIKDGNLYRAYYDTIIPGYKGPRQNGGPSEITCYAESTDGIKWLKPNLGLCEINGSSANNVILHEQPFCANFSPFLDARPGKDRGKRFKALAGFKKGYKRLPESQQGLYAFESEDGIHWTKMQDRPVITSKAFAFDSQNVAFWSEAEGCYVCYFRTRSGGLRTISRTVSPDFLHWDKSVLANPNLPGEHLYTNQTHPYFRAPHIYIALPTRFLEKRGGTEDILFMTSRAGSTSYTRLFKEAFIRPGLDRERWGNRSNYVALNVVPTGPAEMSIYHAVSGHRYVLRTDGFVSARAGFTKGELLTKPLTFSGKELILNYSTSAAGSVQVEIQDANGTPFSGFRLEDCPMIIGDEIERRVEWKQQPDLGAFQGKPVRLRFVMTDCDLYSFRFQ